VYKKRGKKLHIKIKAFLLRRRRMDISGIIKVHLKIQNFFFIKIMSK
jgi:hypothetical protein